MLKLIDITKDYVGKNQPTVNALKGISINFRRSEFVAILGQSGCGKTTLLNIVGGLDRYTSGDLVINGTSTKDYKDGDWDTFRNHSVGFIFQSYNLIGHISVLKNVEMALIIAGVSKEERTQRAMAALEKVGLAGKEKSRPNQLSGGEQQRVSIARALVNNPDVLLADEPTGALDSETSIEVMDLLKELAKERLVVMVTHNPELAEQYATRIVRMHDGLLISDSNPLSDEEELNEVNEYLEKVKNKEIVIESKGSKEQTSMSFKTAMGLTMNNMRTKMARTVLVSIAGSIGIIGIALVLSISNGFSGFVNDIESDTMSSYPLNVKQLNTDSTGVMNSLITSLFTTSDTSDLEAYPSGDKIIQDNSMEAMLASMLTTNTRSDTEYFKEFLDTDYVRNNYSEYISSIQYTYNITKNIYIGRDSSFVEEIPYYQVSPLTIDYGEHYNSLDMMFVNQFMATMDEYFDLNDIPIFDELIPAYDYDYTVAPEDQDGQQYSNLLNEQYEVVAGEMPKAYNEIVVVVNEYNQLYDYQLIGMGLISPEHLVKSMVDANFGWDSSDSIFQLYSDPDSNTPLTDESYFNFEGTYSDLLGLTYYVPMNYKLYEYIEDDTPSSNLEELGGHYEKKSDEDIYKIIDDDPDTIELKVVGVLRPQKGATSTSINGCIGYLPSLTQYLMNKAEESRTAEGYNTIKSNVILAQEYYYDEDGATGTNVLSGDSFVLLMNYESLMRNYGIVDQEAPNVIYIYPSSFSAKDQVYELVDKYDSYLEYKYYNIEDSALRDKESDEYMSLAAYLDEHAIILNDDVSTMMDSVERIVNSVTYVLIAFVAISLIVSCIMIGVITYVSVLERTKEIGILRAMGARKRDISRIFNAETFLVGLIAGLLGVGIALLLDFPIIAFIRVYSGVTMRIIVPWYGIVFLPIISFVLTLISGLIPSYLASKRDPVVALRSE
ncbi:MAG: ABC transporter ATP-binding protein/permease [Coprobacillus sp.]|nr:ABC transporter ATP-binding protein/permease [Coprobacillus sp.]